MPKWLSMALYALIPPP
jgi:hypothetical protein